ncbi:MULTISPECIES: AAA family ATPase [Halomonadaceae]|jgi:AAA15 family ATPase/GTPase|uniref:AAA family ATPase n=1 Tax=Halomonadaceae TaxID=28256 RepID=UPI000780FC31|nr:MULTISPECIES: ATP-binding protein [Halomonas]MCC4287893.1 AAA family ATPase [Halomonas meridiana]MCP1304163.1 AAA family ATPase [Halomonas sp. R1t8]MCP1330334.1 AAA family ATPase [Halomonas sp. R1t4]
MIATCELSDFGPITSFNTEGFDNLNLIIGKNSSGKTWLLKLLYAVIRSQEEHGRGDDNREFYEVLSDKLYWTFQTDHLGDLVKKGKQNRLKLATTMQDGGQLTVEFSATTSKQVKPSHNTLLPRTDNTIFLPPKEVLSLWNIILKSALQDRTFGYDATYSDLVLALQNQPQKGRNYDSFSQSRSMLEAMFQGRVVFEDNQWIYKQGHAKYSIHGTAEGIKKIAILDTLLGNRFLSPHSVIFIDEPESALHPTAIIKLLDILGLLAKQGIQVFMATHSYYVVKKMVLMAKQTQKRIPCFMPNDDGVWSESCLLRDGLPDNDIINASIRLFEEEFDGI